MGSKHSRESSSKIDASSGVSKELEATINRFYKERSKNSTKFHEHQTGINKFVPKLSNVEKSTIMIRRNISNKKIPKSTSSNAVLSGLKSVVTPITFDVPCLESEKSIVLRVENHFKEHVSLKKRMAFDHNYKPKKKNFG